MSLPPSDSFTYLTGVDRASMVPVIEEALRRAGIPYHSGLQSTPVPRVILSVPLSRLEEAKRAIERETALRGATEIPVVHVPVALPAADPAEEDEDEEDEEEARLEPADVKFPWGPVQAVAAVVLLHFAVVFALVGSEPTVEKLIAAGGLVTGRSLVEPWRLVTSLFVHVDPAHVFWNAVSMLVFAVPLLVRHGHARTWPLYLTAGVAGNLAALASTLPGTVTVGSSGAVAGLFGAWVAGTLRSARLEELRRRARVRTLGIALLVLPSLLTPMTQGGESISVAAHLGGLATGLIVGVWLGERRGRSKSS